MLNEGKAALKQLNSPTFMDKPQSSQEVKSRKKTYGDGFFLVRPSIRLRSPKADSG